MIIHGPGTSADMTMPQGIGLHDVAIRGNLVRGGKRLEAAEKGSDPPSVARPFIGQQPGRPTGARRWGCWQVPCRETG